METTRKLISMVDYVDRLIDNEKLESDENYPLEVYHKVHAYKTVLTNKLKLWMFIACKDGKPLEEPEVMDVHWGDDDEKEQTIKWNKDRKEYQEAQNRCIFEGFTLSVQNDLQFETHHTGGMKLIWSIRGGVGCFHKDGEEVVTTIEDLVPHHLTLTSNAIKELKI